MDDVRHTCCCILTILFWWILVKKYQLQGKSFDLSVLIPEEKSDEESHSEEKAKKRIVLLVFVSTLLLWLTSEWTGIPVAAVSGIPIVFLTMLGIIDADDVRTLPWDTLMLVAGGLALGLAVQEQGLVDYYIQKLSNFEIQPVTVFLMFGMLTVVISNFMSNTAAVSIILPVAVTFVATISGTNPIITPVIVGLAASCALALPVSTPPNAVAYSYGKVEQKEFLYGGLVMGLAGPLIILFWVLLLQWLS
jgi:solute carrier family 13 (sodium-dependent dicarboxylate transporter), member 2/3/5